MRKGYYESVLNLIKVIDLLSKRKYDPKVVIDLTEYSSLFYKSWCLKKCVMTSNTCHYTK